MLQLLGCHDGVGRSVRTVAADLSDTLSISGMSPTHGDRILDSYSEY
jgi:hypothetical protein